MNLEHAARIKKVPTLFEERSEKSSLSYSK
jgi:hypothetical protein